MFSESKVRKAEKIIKKALKLINKEVHNDAHHLGRYEVRDCFHQISATKEKGLLMSYCFEFVDKATNIKKFYGFATSTIAEKITVKNFLKTLRKLLDTFITTAPMHPKDNYGKRVNYKRVKID